MPSPQRAGSQSVGDVGVESLNLRLPAAQRRLKFAREYIRNGYNGKQAAIAAGYAGHSAESMASTLLRDPKVQAHVAKLTRRYTEKVDLTIENTLLEVRRIAYMNANDFITEDGSPVPPEDWSPAMGACVQAIKWDNGKVREIKFWSKTEALNKAMKHLVLLEQNNAQKADKSRSLEIVFVPRMLGGLGPPHAGWNSTTCKSPSCETMDCWHDVGRYELRLGPL